MVFLSFLISWGRRTCALDVKKNSLSNLSTCNSNLSSKVGGLILCSRTLRLVTFAFGSNFSLDGSLLLSSVAKGSAGSLLVPLFPVFLFLFREGFGLSLESGVLDFSCVSASHGSSFSQLLTIFISSGASSDELSLPLLISSASEPFSAER